MEINIVNKFFKCINCLVEREKLIAALMYYGAPLFKEDKASVLINFTKTNKELYYIWDKYKESGLLDEKHDYFELKKNDKVISVLFYNKDRLESIFKNQEVKEFISQYGYNENMPLHEKLQYLSERFKEKCPHEIGVFLGYPLRDVIAFIEDCGKNCLHCGYWKVYHNKEYALDRFNAYDKAKENIIELILSGTKPSNVII